MKKIAICLLVLSMSYGMFSCKNDDFLSSEIQSFEASISSTNALRAEIQVSFAGNTTYQIEYWPTADETEKRTTQSYEGTQNSSATLILLKPDTEYSYRVLYNGKSSDTKTFVTLSTPVNIPKHNLYVDNIQEHLPGYILSYIRSSPGAVYLMDTKGNVVWYETVEEGVLVANIDTKTNHIYMLTGPTSEVYSYNGQYVKVIDLLGNKIMSKDLLTIPELADRQIHHECRPLPDGSVLLVSYVDREFDLRAQGGSEKEMVKGDGYVVMDMKGYITQMWDCFAHIDPREDPNVMNTKSSWVHGNSANYDTKGNFYMTFRNLSQLWKIDSKTGEVKYRVGRNGTVTMPESGNSDGLHCANPYAPDEVMVFDNEQSGNQGSRAIMYKINEAAQTADVTINSELPHEYSSALRGNAQKISNNMLMFGSGVARLVLFTDMQPKAKILRAISTPQPFYRTEYIPTIEF